MSSNNQYQMVATPAPIGGTGKLTSIITDPAPNEIPVAIPYQIVIKPSGGQPVITQNNIMALNVIIDQVPVGSFDYELNDAGGRKQRGTSKIGTVLGDGTVIYDTVIIHYPSPA